MTHFAIAVCWLPSSYSEFSSHAFLGSVEKAPIAEVFAAASEINVPRKSVTVSLNRLEVWRKLSARAPRRKESIGPSQHGPLLNLRMNDDG